MFDAMIIEKSSSMEKRTRDDDNYEIEVEYLTYLCYLSASKTEYYTSESKKMKIK